MNFINYLSFLVILDFIMLATPIFAGEGDTFTRRNEDLGDATAVIEYLFKEELIRSVNNTSNCKKEQLTEYLRYNLDTNFGNVREQLYLQLSKFNKDEKSITKQIKNQKKKYRERNGLFYEDIKKLNLTFQGIKPEESIYALPSKQSTRDKDDKDILRGLGKKMRNTPEGRKVLEYLGDKMNVDLNKAMLQEQCCENNINLCGTRISIDKIDHFFGHGHVLYKASLEKGERVALQEAMDRDRSSWGLLTNGVMSYGDLAANFKGMLFWKDLLDEKNQYFLCKNGKFTLNEEAFKTLDLCRYIDDAFDEAYNCSSYPSEEDAQNVLNNIAQRTSGKTCPLDKSICKNLKEKYQNIKIDQGQESALEYVLHPECIIPSETPNLQRFVDHKVYNAPSEKTFRSEIDKEICPDADKNNHFKTDQEAISFLIQNWKPICKDQLDLNSELCSLPSSGSSPQH